MYFTIEIEILKILRYADRLLLHLITTESMFTVLMKTTAWIDNYLLFQSTPADDAAKHKKTDEPTPDDETDATANADTKPLESFIASAEDEEEDEVQNKPEEAQVQAETVGGHLRLTVLLE